MELRTDWNDFNEERLCYTLASAGDYWVDLVPMLFNHRMVLTPKAHPEGYPIGWCFSNFATALMSFAMWLPQGADRDTWEPIGALKRVGYFEDVDWYGLVAANAR